MHPIDVVSSDAYSPNPKEKMMATTLTSPLEEDILNQARAEAREILKNSEETTIELTVSGRESQQLGDALNQVIQHVLHALARARVLTFRLSLTI